MRGNQAILVFYIVFEVTFFDGAALAQDNNYNYNGPSVANRLVSTQIGQVIYRFPRNYILNNLNGLRLGLDMSSGGGVSSGNIKQFERWGGGTSNTPLLLEAEITPGSWSQSTSAYRDSLKDESPDIDIGDLRGYRFSPQSMHYLAKSNDPTLIFCDDLARDCQMTFDVSNANGILVRFSHSKLPEWANIESFVKNIIRTYGSDLK